ncbi:acyl carrier protein [Oceanobacter mangrovi]|uniref:acyl carrier protein n=1 Tax=Oceanobacter mangrovi TaxID=2862510 RepID=UPI001C8EB4D8|nr:acyl carrier protein [Oceanobacter mangrovi]
MNRDEIQNHITRVLCDLFGLDKDQISPEARLYEDLDIDSIDAVDMVVEMKKITGKKINPEDFKSVRTVGDVINAVEALYN